MSELIYLLLGTALLIVIIYDFFFTTLSISGAGFISRGISLVSYKIIHVFAGIFGRKAFSYSGLVVSLSIFFTWLTVVWIGLFFIFSSNPEAITNSQGRVATGVERLYYTGYVLSTLGMGNFFSTTDNMELLTSIFSFFGFIFFTSSITYFLSVSSAVINKRSLARSIERLGKTPENIADKLLKVDSSFAYQQIMNCQTMLDKHVSNHQAYPVIHYYSHPEPEFCLGINMARLDEAMGILLSSDKADKIKEELMILRKAITSYLQHLDMNYHGSLPKGEGEISSKPLNYKITGIAPADLSNRRKILRGILKAEGYDWRDITPANQ